MATELDDILWTFYGNDHRWGVHPVEVVIRRDYVIIRWAPTEVTAKALPMILIIQKRCFTVDVSMYTFIACINRTSSRKKKATRFNPLPKTRKVRSTLKILFQAMALKYAPHPSITDPVEFGEFAVLIDGELTPLKGSGVFFDLFRAWITPPKSEWYDGQNMAPVGGLFSLPVIYGGYTSVDDAFECSTPCDFLDPLLNDSYIALCDFTQSTRVPSRKRLVIPTPSDLLDGSSCLISAADRDQLTIKEYVWLTQLSQTKYPGRGITINEASIINDRHLFGTFRVITPPEIKSPIDSNTLVQCENNTYVSLFPIYRFDIYRCDLETPDDECLNLTPGWYVKICIKWEFNFTEYELCNTIKLCDPSGIPGEGSSLFKTLMQYFVDKVFEWINEALFSFLNGIIVVLPPKYKMIGRFIYFIINDILKLRAVAYIFFCPGPAKPKLPKCPNGDLQISRFSFTGSNGSCPPGTTPITYAGEPRSAINNFSWPRKLPVTKFIFISLNTEFEFLYLDITNSVISYTGPHTANSEWVVYINGSEEFRSSIQYLYEAFNTFLVIYADGIEYSLFPRDAILVNSTINGNDATYFFELYGSYYTELTFDISVFVEAIVRDNSFRLYSVDEFENQTTVYSVSNSDQYFTYNYVEEQGLISFDITIDGTLYVHRSEQPPIVNVECHYIEGGIARHIEYFNSDITDYLTKVCLEMSDPTPVPTTSCMGCDPEPCIPNLKPEPEPEVEPTGGSSHPNYETVENDDAESALCDDPPPGGGGQSGADPYRCNQNSLPSIAPEYGDGIWRTYVLGSTNGEPYPELPEVAHRRERYYTTFINGIKYQVHKITEDYWDDIEFQSSGIDCIPSWEIDAHLRVGYIWPQIRFHFYLGGLFNWYGFCQFTPGWFNTGIVINLRRRQQIGYFAICPNDPGFTSPETSTPLPKPDFIAPAPPPPPPLPPPVNECEAIMWMSTIVYFDARYLVDKYAPKIVGDTIDVLLLPPEVEYAFPNPIKIEEMDTAEFAIALYTKLVEILAGILPPNARDVFLDMFNTFKPVPLNALGCSKCDGEPYIDSNAPDPNYPFARDWYWRCSPTGNNVKLPADAFVVPFILNQGYFSIPDWLP